MEVELVVVTRLLYDIVCADAAAGAGGVGGGGGGRLPIPNYNVRVV